MSEPGALSRWLPTLVGGLLALGVAVSYELDWLGRGSDCEPCPSCEKSPENSAPRARPDPLLAGTRPRPGRRESAEDLAIEDQLVALETQAELLAERAVTGELSYYGFSEAELEAMARHCDVRTDYPTKLGDQEAEDLGLERAEREAWDRALAKFAAQEQDYYRALLGELAPDTPDLDTLALAQIRRQLTKTISRGRGEGDDELQRHVAEERAGLRDAPDDPAALSAYNRYNRLRFNAGDRFAELLGEELGGDRVHELRSAFGGWPGARTRQWGCPDDAD